MSTGIFDIQNIFAPWIDPSFSVELRSESIGEIWKSWCFYFAFRRLLLCRAMRTKTPTDAPTGPYSGLPDLPPISIFRSQGEGYPSPATAQWHTEAQEKLIEGIRELRNDHTSGAKELATKAVAPLVRIARIIESGLTGEKSRPGEKIDHKDKSQLWWDAVRKAGWAISTYGRPSSNSPGNKQELMIDLRIMESRPLCEGAELARILAAQAAGKGCTHNLKIQLASDASVAILARDADIVLLGADRISGSGDISNKTGSLPAVLCAKSVSNKAVVIALSDIEKVAKPGRMDEHEEEDNNPTELVNAWSPQAQECISQKAWKEMVRVRNVYFEWVPANYIDHYLCETGVLCVDDIRKQSEWVLQAEQRLFGDVEGLNHG
ncbi:hypothetical protein CIHG_00948 [Coccidioides immitis H538.4]|uniref:Translation initiation factor eIF-2B subunit family protein n=1 Tax=Coccidioides immitis H538.4 TaxID=396776 RepID=A0A0J8RF25_COCIT|nr:hypothetical protein CIHG_00948 [Coccidioides immitis H538.4]